MKKNFKKFKKYILKFRNFTMILTFGFWVLLLGFTFCVLLLGFGFGFYFLGFTIVFSFLGFVVGICLGVFLRVNARVHILKTQKSDFGFWFPRANDQFKTQNPKNFERATADYVDSI